MTNGQPRQEHVRITPAQPPSQAHRDPRQNRSPRPDLPLPARAGVLLLTLVLTIFPLGCRQVESTAATSRQSAAPATPTSASPATQQSRTPATATTASYPGTQPSVASGASGALAPAAPGSVAIGSLSTRDIGRSVLVIGTVRAIQRQASGHALVTLSDASGTLPVYIRQETRVDQLALTVGEAYQVSGRIQSYEGHIELVPAGGGDVRLTDGYDFEPVQVVSVIDGDTLRIRSRDGAVQTLRVIGVDTPEKPLDGQPAEFYAAEATAFADRTLRGKTVYLERDNSETDRYGRLLRYVWLAEPAAITPEAVARANFSALLLQGGYAEFIDVGSDDKYRSVFEPWELQAQQARKGMWAKR